MLTCFSVQKRRNPSAIAAWHQRRGFVPLWVCSKEFFNTAFQIVEFVDFRIRTVRAQHLDLQFDCAQQRRCSELRLDLVGQDCSNDNCPMR